MSQRLFLLLPLDLRRSAISPEGVPPVSVVLGEGLTLTPPSQVLRVEGQTSQKNSAAGSAHDWILGIEGHASLIIRDTHWENGERDLRPMMSEPRPADMPLPLALLHGKRRAGIHEVPHRNELSWMTVKTVRPGKNDWPSQTSPSLESLDEICGKEIVESALAQGIVALGTKTGRCQFVEATPSSWPSNSCLWNTSCGV